MIFFAFHSSNFLKLYVQDTNNYSGDQVVSPQLLRVSSTVQCLFTMDSCLLETDRFLGSVNLMTLVSRLRFNKKTNLQIINIACSARVIMIF